MFELKEGWLWDDLKQAGMRAAQMAAKFWRGRTDAKEHGRCYECGNPLPHRHE